MQSGVVSYFVFEQLDKNRKEFEKVPFETFYKKMEASTVYVNRFQDYLGQGGIIFSLEKQKEMVNNYLIAEFTRQLYDEEKYFEIILKNDPMILEVLKQKNKL